MRGRRCFGGLFASRRGVIAIFGGLNYTSEAGSPRRGRRLYALRVDYAAAGAHTCYG